MKDATASPPGTPAIRSATIRQGMAEKAAQGGVVGPVPLGYRLTGYQVTARAEPDEAVAPLLREAFEQAARPEGSLRAVLARLVELGAKGRRGRPITLSTLQRMLHDPFYKGMVRCDGKLVRGSHRPLVEDETFGRVQRQLRKRRCL